MDTMLLSLVFDSQMLEARRPAGSQYDQQGMAYSKKGGQDVAGCES